MDGQLKLQLRQVLTYYSVASLDYAGQAQFGSAATTWCRVENFSREIPVGSDLIEERTEHRVIIDETWPLSYDATKAAGFVLPGETEVRRTKFTSFCIDEFGTLDHVELFV